MEMEKEKLFEAAAAGDLEILGAALADKETSYVWLVPDMRNDEGMTLLMVAARAGHLPAVHLLLDAGANPNRGVRETEEWRHYDYVSGGLSWQIPDEDGWFGPVHDPEYAIPKMAVGFALEEGHEEVALALIQAGAVEELWDEVYDDLGVWETAARFGRCKVLEYRVATTGPKAKGEYGIEARCWGPLREAAVRGQADAVRLLLEAGADPESPDEESETALMLAAQSGSVETVKHFLEAGADPNRWSQGESPLGHAAKCFHPDIYNLLLPVSDEAHRRGAAQELPWGMARKMRDQPLGEALVMTAYHGLMDQMKALLDAGAPIDHVGRGGRTALMWAVSGTLDPEMVDLLLDAGADPNVESIDYGSDLGQTAVMWVCCSQTPKVQRRIWQRLKEAGADFDQRNGEGETACLLALRQAEFADFSILLDLGADPDVTDFEGNSPLVWATYGRRFGQAGFEDFYDSAIQILRGHGASESGLERVKLLEAIDKGNAEKVDELLRDGVDPNFRLAYTPLCEAARRGNVPIMELLIEAGADVDRRIEDPKYGEPKSEQDWNPLLFAADSGHLDAVRFLIEAGADKEVGFRAMGSASDLAYDELKNRWPREPFRGNQHRQVIEYLDSIGTPSYVERRP